MDIPIKILLAVLGAAALVWLVIVLDRKIARLADIRRQVLACAWALIATSLMFQRLPRLS